MLRRALIGLLFIGGCVTPSIPIPPPEPEAMTFEVDLEAGAATFVYDPEPNFANAVVYIFNRDLGRGLITTARADGSVGPTAPFEATVGHNISVTFETDEAIVGSCVQLRPGGGVLPYCTR
jgi:hypothetical protein